MRSIMIGLSLIFFTLSAFIVFRASELPVQIPLANIPLADLPLVNTPPVYTPAYPDQPNDAPVESSALTQNSTGRQDDGGSAIATDLETTNAKPEDKPITTEKTSASIHATDFANHPRILTVFGGQTFRSGHDIINDAAASKIEKLINEISVFPNSLLIIEGHTDNIPTGKLHKDNMELSVRRAKAIANILISRGIPQERISVIGYGDTHPISTNNTEEGRATNRRVEVKLMLKKGGN
ncbi:flagellar motor protein MotB [Nitrosomonas sp. Nm84]|uniref:OmpA family protein n=1 Tax=Nitrosomonas sp. Nm84 TaxID=200124 RepID=UPI000D869C14|nr:OmpA family protein [Nitrosomonas sp. Nm84]PXW83458.1 flagellar motor protein MotB [Nitrosomonas sp. Nm84]